MKTLLLLLLLALPVAGQTYFGNATLGNYSTSGAVTNTPAPSGDCTNLFYGTGYTGTNSGLIAMTEADIACVGVTFTTTNTTAICDAAVYMAVDPSYPNTYDVSIGIYTGTASAWTDTAVGTVVTNQLTITSYVEQRVAVNTGTLVSGTNYWLVVKKLTTGGQIWLSGGGGFGNTRVRCATMDDYGANGIAFNTWHQ